MNNPISRFTIVPMALILSFAGLGSASAQMPVITVQPQSTSAVLGYPASFSVSADNATGYQWRKESVIIPGETGDTLMLSSVKYADAGSYSVLISNGSGIVASSSAALTVTPPLAGELDFTFNPGAGVNGYVYSVAVQADGKVLLGGHFTTVNGTARRYIARLNSDGSLDTSFNSGTGANSTVYSVAVQTDGKVLLGGEFTTVNGTARQYIARLNADGSLDTGFQNGMAGANDSVWSVVVHPDDKVLISGRLTSVNGTNRNRIARLNADGSLDTGFQNGMAGANSYVDPVAVQPDGKVLIGGLFTSVNGTYRRYIARLNADGSLDTGFQNGMAGANSYVTSVAVQPDGKVLLGGHFTTVNGTLRNKIARLNADGSLDTGFQNGMAGANSYVLSMAVQPDGKVLLGGSFTTVNGTARSRIARLNSDGSLDSTFNPGSGADNIVRSMASQPDGKVLLGGEFTTVNGTARNGIARLYGEADPYDASDTDGDGLPNAWERENGLDPEVPNRRMGNGSDGPLNIEIGDVYTDDVWAQVLGSNPAGSATLNVSTTNGFAANDLVLIVTMQDPDTDLAQNKAGTYEFGRIESLTASSMTLTQPRSNAFTVATSEKIQVLKVPEYTDVTATGAALQFDGVDDYVSVDSGVNLANRSFSIEFWAQQREFGRQQDLVSQGVNTTHQGLIIGFTWENKVFFTFYGVNLYGPAYQSTLWHHWAFTYDASTQERMIFRDGLPVVTDNAQADYQGSGPLFLGSRFTSQNFNNGSLDEVRIWDVARNATEISNSMHTALSGEESGLLAYYRFNEGAGTNAYDSTPNHHDGILVDGPTWTASGSLTCQPWNGTNGGVLAFLANSVTLGDHGVISAEGKGYRGGEGVPSVNDYQWGIAGERTTGVSTVRESDSFERAQGGGGAGRGGDGSGGGGAYGSNGGNGDKYSASSDFGRGAQSFGTNALTRLYFGGGGGGSGSHSSGAAGVAGGAGGGIIVIAAGSIEGSGAISSSGAKGANGHSGSSFNTAGSGGGGGAGGSIWLTGNNKTGSASIHAEGGAGGDHHPTHFFGKEGGPGGVGRIRLDIPASLNTPEAISPAPGFRAQLSVSNTATALFWSDYLDSDNDGLNDWEEFVQGAMPNNVDTDGDGMFDGWEQDNGLSPTNGTDAAEDSDGDGVANIIEFQRGTNPGISDSDDDSLSDYDELFIYHTDPNVADTDGDGIDDNVELAAGSDPLSIGALSMGHRYYYDGLDRLVGVDYINGLSLLYTYDGNDNLVRQACFVGDANTNGVPDAWEQLHGLTNGIFADTDGDGSTDGQEWWAGTNPGSSNSVPLDLLGPAGSNIIDGIVFPFTPSNYVVGVGQLDGIGAEEIVISADGDPGSTTNFLMILSQTTSGWSTQRVDVGVFGVTSIAVGQPANRLSPAIYVGLRNPNGTGREEEFIFNGGSWTRTTMLNSTDEAGFVLGVRPGRDVLVSQKGTTNPAGTPYYLAYNPASSEWDLVQAHAETSRRGLGIVTTPGLHGIASRGVRLLDAGGVQVLGDEGLVPDNMPVWNPDYSRWFCLEHDKTTWDAAQSAAVEYGGNLATVTDANLNNWLILKFLDSAEKQDYGYWIGLSRNNTLAPWQWASGERFDFGASAGTGVYPWRSGEPNGSMGVNGAGVHVYSPFGSTGWNDAVNEHEAYPLIELRVEGPSVSTNEPPVFNRRLWRGHSLCSGDLRLTNAVSILYAAIADQNRNDVLDTGDEFMLTEYLFDGKDLKTNDLQRIQLTGNALSDSYGLACVDVLYGNQQVLFTAEPDGRIFSWSATNGTTALQRQLFSRHDQGQAWHALSGVKTLEAGQSLLGLRVDLSTPDRCDVVLWPPMSELSTPPDYPQTAPIAQILPEPNSGANNALVDIRVWDAEANASKLTLEYQRPFETVWRAAASDLSGYLTTHPTGTTHTVRWNAGLDLGSGFFGTVQLRARAQDSMLTGEWTTAMPYLVDARPDNNPIAFPDYAIINMSGQTSINVLTNDTVNNDAAIRIHRIATQPTNGTVSIESASEGWVSYTPGPDFTGDRFTYEITDGFVATGSYVVVGGGIVVDGNLGFTADQFGFHVIGLSEWRAVVESSTNLLSGDWVPISTNDPGPLDFSDPQTNSLPSCFYRVRFLP